MTTIAYRDGVLAADGRSTSGHLIVNDKTTKIHRLSDGVLFALAGNDAYEAPMLYALEEGGPLPAYDFDNDGGFIAVLVEVDGTLKTYEGEGDFSYVTDQFAAFGSGADFAYGAMEMGATAERAVQVACRRDKNSGGVVHSAVPGHEEP